MRRILWDLTVSFSGAGAALGFEGFAVAGARPILVWTLRRSSEDISPSSAIIAIFRLRVGTSLILLNSASRRLIRASAASPSGEVMPCSTSSSIFGVPIRILTSSSVGGTPRSVGLASSRSENSCTLSSGATASSASTPSSTSRRATSITPPVPNTSSAIAAPCVVLSSCSVSGSAPSASRALFICSAFFGLATLGSLSTDSMIPQRWRVFSRIAASSSASRADSSILRAR